MTRPSDNARSVEDERLDGIRARHGDDRPCSMHNDECFLLAEVERLRRALYECAKAAGEDVSGGPPTWPDVADWAIEAVRQMREDYDRG